MERDTITIYFSGGEEERDIINAEFIQFAWDLKARLDKEWSKDRNWGWTLDSTRYFVEPNKAGKDGGT